jgi:putative flippase GtrA
MNTVAQDALKYLIASGCALFVDISVLWVLVQYFSWWYLAAATISFLSGIAVVYVLSVGMVFNHRRLKDRRIEFLSFTAIGGAGLAINAAVIFAAVKYLGVHYLVAKCVAAGFTFAFNFFARRQLLFTRRPARDRRQYDYDLQR